MKTSYLIASLLFLIVLIPPANASGSGAPLLPTPFGYMPGSCVHAVPSQTILLSNGVSTTAVFPNGTSILLPPCPGYSPQPNSWIEDGNYQLTNAELAHFSGKWTVPSSPSSNDGQTIFYFIGSTDTQGYLILQPVLQWGSAADGGGAYWVIASWAVSSGGTVAYSTPQTVSAGDTINGTIDYVGSGTCGQNSRECYSIFAKDTTSGSSSSLTNQDVNGQWVLYGTLESYNIKSCSDYSSGGSLSLGSLSVSDRTGKVTPSWSTYVNSNASPQCSFSVKTTSTTITLYYS